MMLMFNTNTIQVKNKYNVNTTQIPRKKMLMFDTNRSQASQLTKVQPWNCDDRMGNRRCKSTQILFLPWKYNSSAKQIQFKYNTNTIHNRRKTAGVSLLSALFWANCPFSGLNSDQNVSKYEKSLSPARRQKTTDIDYPGIQYGWGDSNLNPVSINVSILMFAGAALPPLILHQ